MANKTEPGLEVPIYLRQWRKYRGLSQEALAAMVGLSAPNISQLETRKQGFTDKSLAVYAQALGCSPAELLAHDPTRADSFWPLFQAAEQLTGVDRARAYAIIKAVLRLP